MTDRAPEALQVGKAALAVHERINGPNDLWTEDSARITLQMLLASTGGFDFTGKDCMRWMGEAGFHEPQIKPLVDHQTAVIGQK